MAIEEAEVIRSTRAGQAGDFSKPEQLEISDALDQLFGFGGSAYFLHMSTCHHHKILKEGRAHGKNSDRG
jgi:hypothetical protein